ncbi:uncharacterized protein LOC135808292 [Sycon ciliatum]|uniref:uncharacterized protein LOC135808292 n=1 Tax=Sycon ciliatum TaxID=27933 RepID=UPI0020ACFAA2
MAAERNSTGYLQADATTFPSGMKALGDYIHGKGLKYGLYGDPGTMTCQRRAGNENHEKIDALTYAEYGADYFKYDSCYASHDYQLHAYMDMRDALNATGRPIAYSICPDASRCNNAKAVMWDASSVANVIMCRGDGGGGWCRSHPGLFPESDQLGDINPTWHSWTCILESNIQFDSMRYAGPGHYIMPDIMEVGNGMTTAEDISHFSLWAMIAAPLIAGNDVRSMSKTTLDILTNEEVIAVNQDPQGKPGRRIYQSENKTAEVWSRQLYDGNYAVVLFNRDNSTEQAITLQWSYVGLPNDQPASLRDLWLHKELGVKMSNYTSQLPPHSVLMMKVTQVKGG